MRSIALASALAGLAVTPASARDWPDAGGWSIGELDNGTSCYVTQEFEGAGETSLMLTLNVDNTVLLSALNANWTSKPGQTYQLTYVLDAGEYSDHASIGFESGGRKGFVGGFEPSFPSYFGTLVDQLSLKGTGPAVALGRACVATLKAKADAAGREKARLEHIPIDPFAEPRPVQPK